MEETTAQIIKLRRRNEPVSFEAIRVTLQNRLDKVKETRKIANDRLRAAKEVLLKGERQGMQMHQTMPSKNLVSELCGILHVVSVVFLRGSSPS